MISAIAGLVVGVLSELFFERRATKAAVAHNAWLQSELAAVRERLRFVQESLCSAGRGARPV